MKHLFTEILLSSEEFTGIKSTLKLYLMASIWGWEMLAVESTEVEEESKLIKVFQS